MTLDLTWIISYIGTTIAGESAFDGFDFWFGPPRISFDASARRVYLTGEQVAGEFDTKYTFELSLITQGGLDSNHVWGLDAYSAIDPMYASALVALFDGVTGPEAGGGIFDPGPLVDWVSTVTKAIYLRETDKTTFKITVEFVPASP